MDTRPFMQQRLSQVLATAVLGFIIIALGAYAYATLEEAQYVNIGPTTINVVGEGEVLAVPDIATFSFSVLAQAADASAAQTQSAEAVNEIIAYLTAEGIEERDIKTQSYNLNPRYRYEDRVCPMGSYCPPSEPILDGFEVSQTVSVKVRDTEAAGALISGVGERGATNISGLQFTIDDEDALAAAAREQAIADAQAKAEALADDLGVRIVRMVGYWEEQGPMPYYGYGKGGDMAFEEAMVAPSLPVGENSTVSRVNITYQVR